MDTDFHRIYKEKVHINADCNIVINNKVWVGNRAMILKGAIIERGCIIPAALKVTSNNCISREKSILGSQYCGSEPLNWEH
jgi:acetyltransferase-like isoleucine patch superfamily enzyme